jgi:hypothetical protein
LGDHIVEMGEGEAKGWKVVGLNLAIFFCGEMRCHRRVAQQRRSGKIIVQADDVFHE